MTKPEDSITTTIHLHILTFLLDISASLIRSISRCFYRDTTALTPN